LDVEELGLYDFVQLVRTRRRTLGWTMAATTIMGLLIGIFSRPVYLAETVLAPLSTGGVDGQGIEGLGSSLGGIASLVGLGGKNGASDIEQNIAVLRSRALADHFINQYQLAIVLFANRWDKGEGRWKKGLPNPIMGRVSRLLNSLSGDTVRVRPSDGAPTPDEIYRAFDKVRSVDRQEKSGLVTLGMKWHDPIVAAAWASEYVTAANDYVRAQKISEAQRSLTYLEEQIQKTSLTEMHNALYKLVESETKQSMVANVREEFAFRIIDPATAPELRVSPKRVVLLGIGLMGGFMLGLGIILVQNYFSVMRIARRG
jgi:uncharacterized protein involved in exopolysaccharide biosynthesis